MTMGEYEVALRVQIARVQTLADGTPRLTFDCQEGQTEQAAMLMEYQAQGIPGKLVFEPDLSGVNETESNKSEQNAGKY
jgi:hypothetical protein